jgi:hypothetical protein
MRGAGHSTLERRLLIDQDKMAEMTKMHREDTNPRWKQDGQESVRRYSMTDIQGMVQSMMLFGHETMPPPKFTFHEFSLTDSVGHDYGPHDGAVQDALIETDKRVGKILDVIDARGLFDSTLFIITTDHGMAPIDTARAADQVQAVASAGLKCALCMPLVYLLDLAVTVVAAPDGRTANITVTANDVDKHGERPPVEGATVEVISGHGHPTAQATTDAYGVCGVQLPAGEDPERLALRVVHDDYNPRHLRLDGTNLVEDIRQRLYG